VVSSAIIAVANLPHNVDPPAFVLELTNVSKAGAVWWPKINLAPNLDDLRLASFNNGFCRKEFVRPMIERRPRWQAIFGKINAINATNNLGITSADIHYRKSPGSIGVVAQHYYRVDWRRIGGEQYMARDQSGPLRGNKLRLDKLELASACEIQSGGSDHQPQGGNCQNASENRKPPIVAGDSLFGAFLLGGVIGLIFLLGSTTLIYWHVRNI
jgi:hypothetical protein